MITDVKLSNVDTTVGEIRALFVNEHVHSAVIVSDGRLAAVVDRTDVADFYSDDLLAVAVGCRTGRVVAPDADLQAARAALLGSGRRRLAVVERDGRLLGLLCLKRTRRGFCSNSDVHARSRAVRADALLPA